MSRGVLLFVAIVSGLFSWAASTINITPHPQGRASGMTLVALFFGAICLTCLVAASRKRAT